MPSYRETRRRSPTTSTSRRTSAAPARARAVAAEVPRLVEGDGPRRLPGARRLSAHRGQRRPRGLGQLRHVKMPDYRWGIFLADPEPAHDRLRRRHGQARLAGGPGRAPRTRCAASSSPRATPSPRPSSSSACSASTCPSLYDLRNLFQVNVEEGRHLWAMVYLLHTYFGRDGREEAEELLQRRSGDRRQAAHPAAPSTSRSRTGSPS